MTRAFFDGRDSCSAWKAPSNRQLRASGVLTDRAPPSRALKPARSALRVEFDTDVQDHHGHAIRNWSSNGGRGSAPHLTRSIDAVRAQWAGQKKALPSDL